MKRTLIALLAFLALAGAAHANPVSDRLFGVATFGEGTGTIGQLDQWKSETSGGTSTITQNVPTRQVRFSGYGLGCAQFDSNGRISSTGVNCGSGGGTSSSPWLSAGNLVYLASSTNLVGIGTSAPLSALNVAGTNLLATAASSSGITLTNNTPATLGVQQNSPLLSWIANGFATTPANSQQVEFATYVVPTQGTGAPGGTWTLASSVGGSAYATRLSITNAGVITIPGAVTLQNTTTLNRGSLGTSTLTAAYRTTNGTAATALIPVQNSPYNSFESQVWNTTTPANNISFFKNYNAPVSGASPYGNLIWSHQIGTNAFVDLMALSSQGNGRLGVGTTTPQATLSIMGTGTTPLLAIATTTGASMYEFDSDGSLWVNGSAGSSGQCLTSQGSATFPQWLACSGGSGSSTSPWLTGVGTVYTATSTDNVGIGTTTPYELLQIQGSSGTSGATPITLNLMNSMNSTYTVGSESSRVDFASLDTSPSASSRTRARIASIIETTTGGTTGLGFYSSAPDLTEYMRLNGLGYLGIGTSSVPFRLSVYRNTTSAPSVRDLTNTIAFGVGNASAANRYLGQIGFYSADVDLTVPKLVAYISGEAEQTYSSDTTTSSSLRFFTSSSGTATATERMVIDNSGNVGIGTNASDDILHVASSSVGVPLTLKVQNTGGSAEDSELLLSTSGTLTNNSVGASLLGDRVNADGTSDMAFRTSAMTVMTERMRILGSNGNVGIGTTTPATKLQVLDTGTQFRLSYDQSNNVNFTVASNGTLTVAGSQNMVVGGGVNSSFTLQQNSTTRFQMTAGSATTALWTGAQAASAAITADASSGTVPGLIVRRDDTTTGIGANAAGVISFITAATEKMTITNAGNVGVGTTTPTDKLTVSGAIRLTGALKDSTNATGTVGQVLTSTGTSTLWATSGSGSGTVTSGLDGQIAYYGGNGTTLVGSSSFAVASSTGAVSVSSSALTPFNVVGSVNSYMQGNIQNLSSGASASSDWVATANNGSDVSHYIDMGINGGNGAAAPFTTPNHAYLYSIDDTLNIGALGTTSFITFNTTGGLSPVERMRITAAGNVGIGTTTPGTALSVAGTTTTSNLVVGALNGVLQAVNGAVQTGLVNLATQVQGVLAIANGGTNISSYTAGDMLYASATNVLSKLGIGANGTVLQVVAGQPQWVATSTLGFSVPATDYQVFTANGTWTKPSGLTGDEIVIIQAWGGGGAGGNASNRSGGGGGGAMVEYTIKASQMGSTESVTIGAGGTPGAVNGNPGGNTTVGTLLTTFGGGGGGGGSTTSGGGGGGGSLAVGASTAVSTGGTGGSPMGGAPGVGSSFGGGGGSSGNIASPSLAGGDSFYGGGGGSGAANSASGTTGAGGASFWGGGGGGGGSSTGTAGLGGTSSRGGAGGAGATNNNVGSNGVAPAGGGGGGSQTSSGGSGARGEVRIWVIRS